MKGYHERERVGEKKKEKYQQQEDIKCNALMNETDRTKMINRTKSKANILCPWANHCWRFSFDVDADADAVAVGVVVSPS
jgi:hypothetical protein